MRFKFGSVVFGFIIGMSLIYILPFIPLLNEFADGVFILNGIDIHHYMLGIVLVFLAFTRKLKIGRYVRNSFILGFGLALIFDQINLILALL